MAPTAAPSSQTQKQTRVKLSTSSPSTYTLLNPLASQLSDEDASDERSSPRGSPHGADSPDFYDALSREASLESQKEQPPARCDDPVEPEEEERKKPMVHDGWKSTPSGQV
jgi:hypothetical protein